MTSGHRSSVHADSIPTRHDVIHLTIERTAVPYIRSPGSIGLSPVTVAIGGLGALGLPVARAIDADPDRFHLIAVAARDNVRAIARVSTLRHPPRVVPQTSWQRRRS